MKKWSVCLICVLLLIQLLPMTAWGAQGVTIMAATVTAESGQTISVPVRISGNPGFTNSSIKIVYEEKALELIEVKPGPLCTDLTRVHDGKIVSAGADVELKNGVLATAIFKVREGYVGNAAVTPVVEYVRCADDTGNFQDLTITTVPGSIRVEKTGGDGSDDKPQETILGDLNADGRINVLDAALLYGHLAGVQNLTESQLSAADVDGNGLVDRSDAIWLYRYVTKRTTAFPKATEGDQS